MGTTAAHWESCRHTRGLRPRRAVSVITAALLLSATSVVAAMPAVHASAAAVPVLSANGTALVLGNAPINAVGVNARNLAGKSGIGAACAQAQTDAQVTGTINALPAGSFLRFEAFQGGYATSPSGGLDFSGIDRVFQAAAAHQIYLIPVLANQWGQCDDGQQKDLSWFTTGYATAPLSALATAEDGRVPKLSYLAYVAAFAARYASSPALGMYEPIGEPDASTCTGTPVQDGCSAPFVCDETAATAALRSFYDAVGSAISSADPRHLIEAGFGGNTSCGLHADDLLTVGSSSGITVLSFHDYAGAIGLSTSDGTSSDVAEIQRATSLNKPIIDAEVGLQAASSDVGCVTPTQRAAEMAYKEQTQLAAGVSGFLLWNVTTTPPGSTCTQSMTTADPAITAIENGGAGQLTLPSQVVPGASLRGANLAGQNLAGLTFTGVDLTGANLDGATVDGADFTGATLTGVHASGLIGTATVPAPYTIISGTLMGPGLSLAGDVLTNLDLTGVNLAGADLSDTVLTGTVLSGVDLSTTTLEGVTSSNIIGTPLVPSFWQLVGGVLVGPGANLTGVTLAPATIANVDLFGANLSGANLGADTLFNVSSGAITSWGSVVLPPSWVLQGGLLLGPGANLTNAVVSGFSMAGVNLTGATLTGVVAQHLVGCPTLSVGWRCLAGDLLGPGINLSWAHLDGLDLSNLSFDSATLVSTELSHDNLNGTNLAGATLGMLTSSSLSGTPTLPAGTGLVNGMLVGPTDQLQWTNLSRQNLAGLSLVNANLTGTNLTGANLTGTNLTGANLTGVALNGATMSGATLVNATLSGVTAVNIAGCPVLSAGWVCGGGVLIGPGANLAWTAISGVNLSGLSLSGTNLTGASMTNDNLQGTNLSGATLVNVSSSGLTGTPVLPTSTRLLGGVLVNASAQLTWKNLSNQNLAGMSLVNANLTGTNLTGANLTGTNLTGANLTGVALNGATMSGATLVNATLSGVTAVNIAGCPVLSAGWVCGGGVLIGPGANLAWTAISGVNLSGLSLSGTNLTGASMTNDNLQGTNLSGATLVNVSSSGLTGTPVLPTSTRLLGGVLVNASAQLTWKNLSNQNLAGMSLVNANLTGTNLTGANLTGTNLTGANLTAVNLTAVNLTGATLTGVIATKVVGCPTLSGGWTCAGGSLVPPAA